MRKKNIICTAIRIILLFIIFQMGSPIVITNAEKTAADIKTVYRESESAEDTLSETFSINELTIYPVVNNYADENHPLAHNPSAFTFIAGKEYALILSFDFMPEEDQYFQNMIENSEILTSNRGALYPNGALLFVKGNHIGTGFLRLDENYVMTVNVVEAEGSWRSNSQGWWYDRGDGTYPVDQFEEIDGSIYYFDSNGYMVTGWILINGEQYYFMSSGVMKTNAWEGDYYLLSDGKMARNQWVDSGRYYVGADGKWIRNYGIPHWESNSKGWWYDDGYGNYPRSEFKTIDGSVYYFSSSGYMVTGWAAVNGYWYYFRSSGAMKTNAWEGDYYLLSDGKMARNQWVVSGRYYVGADGKWIRNYGIPHWESNSKGWWYDDGYGNYPRSEFKTIDGSVYYFNSSGYMVTGWAAINGYWYYFRSSGAMKTNAWEGDYYLLSDGKMATNSWIGHYYVDGNGKCIAYPYVASKNSEVFHRWNCVDAGKIKPANLIQYSSYEAAARGHRPCKVCNP